MTICCTWNRASSGSASPHESQRHYPNGTLAAHVLGSVDFEEKGNAGIEQGLDEELRGTPGQIRLLTDVNRRGIDSADSTIPTPSRARRSR